MIPTSENMVLLTHVFRPSLLSNYIALADNPAYLGTKRLSQAPHISTWYPSSLKPLPCFFFWPPSYPSNTPSCKLSVLPSSLFILSSPRVFTSLHHCFQTYFISAALTIFLHNSQQFLLPVILSLWLFMLLHIGIRISRQNINTKLYQKSCSPKKIQIWIDMWKKRVGRGR